MSEVFPWADIPRAHTKMWKNEHLPGNMAVLVNAQRPGMRTFEDVLEGANALRRNSSRDCAHASQRRLQPSDRMCRANAERTAHGASR